VHGTSALTSRHSQHLIEQASSQSFAAPLRNDVDLGEKRIAPAELQ
jgi:hypothetical protein